MADFEVLGVIRVDDQGIHVLDGLTSKLGGINQMAERSSGLMSHLGQSVDYMVGNLMTNAFNAVTGAVSNFVSGSFEMNASLEKSTLQFTTLLGNSTAAKEHIAMLYKFAAETPFETGPIIQASKSLLTFGGTALDTEKNIRMVGDAAAAVNQPINEVAFWTGRAYSMIQGGKPFGEAAMRLQEMGLLTATGRTELEKLQKSGADASTVFGAFQEQMGRFGGAMKAQAGTWEGLMSTIKDNVNMVSAQAFKPLFDLVKSGQGILANFVQSADFTQIAANIAGPIEKITAPLSSFLTSFGTMDPKMRTVGNAIGLFAISFRDALGPEMTARMMTFGQNVQGVFDALTDAGPLSSEFSEAIGMLVPPGIREDFESLIRGVQGRAVLRQGWMRGHPQERAASLRAEAPGGAPMIKLDMEKRIEHIFEDVRTTAREFDQGQRKPGRMARDIAEVIRQLATAMSELVK